MARNISGSSFLCKIVNFSKKLLILQVTTYFNNFNSKNFNDFKSD